VQVLKLMVICAAISILALTAGCESAEERKAREAEERKARFEACVSAAVSNAEQACRADPCGAGCKIIYMDDYSAISTCISSCKSKSYEGQQKVCEKAISEVESTATWGGGCVSR
jgi:hypothetical protein